MKLFSVIDRENVDIVLEKKVIKAKEFTQFLEIEELLQKAQQEVTAFKAEAREQMAEARQQQEQQGFLTGQAKWAEHIALLEQKIGQVKQELEKKMVPLVLQCTKKIIGKEFQFNPQLVVEVVKNALKPVSSHRFFTIFVNKEDEAIVHKSKAKLKELLELAESIQIEVRPDIERAGCIIETESGIIDAKLDTLWQSLESTLYALMPPA